MKHTTVYWGYYAAKNEPWLELALQEPTPVLPEFIKSRDVSNELHFTRCPAFSDYYKNTFLIKSPIDITINYSVETKILTINPQKQDFYNELISYRGDHVGKDDPFLMSIALSYLFIADKSCKIELIPASLHDSKILSKFKVIGGTFNIGKWFRPLEFAFELNDPNSPLKIKRGDPLFYVRFVPEDEEKINLIYKNFPKETVEVVNACLYVKDLVNKFQLNPLYKMAEKLRSKLWFNKKKCPFNFNK